MRRDALPQELTQLRELALVADMAAALGVVAVAADRDRHILGLAREAVGGGDQVVGRHALVEPAQPPAARPGRRLAVERLDAEHVDGGLTGRHLEHVDLADRLPRQLDGAGGRVGHDTRGGEHEPLRMAQRDEHEHEDRAEERRAGDPIQSAPNGIRTAQAAVMPPAPTSMTIRFAPGVGKTNANSRPADVCTRSQTPGSERAAAHTAVDQQDVRPRRPAADRLDRLVLVGRPPGAGGVHVRELHDDDPHRGPAALEHLLLAAADDEPPAVGGDGVGVAAAVLLERLGVPGLADVGDHVGGHGPH